jgi:hypothetical protein
MENQPVRLWLFVNGNAVRKNETTTRQELLERLQKEWHEGVIW